MSNAIRISDVVLPKGFSSHQDASSWEQGLVKARSAIDSLWLQRVVYGISEALAMPGVAKAFAHASQGGQGIEFAVNVHWLGEERELGALLLGLFKADFEAIGPVGDARRLDEIRSRFAQVESWTREHPECLFGASKAGFQLRGQGVEFKAGMGWHEVAMALGAQEAAIAMEKSQLAKETQSGGVGASKRV